MTKNQTIITLGMAHTLDVGADGTRSLQRVRDYIGQSVCVHSAPSAWYGILIDASIDCGVISCDLADAGIWTQGQTKDLIRPAQKVTEDLMARRDGLATIPAITAIQPAGYFSESDKDCADEPVLREGRPVPPSVEGTSLEDYAKFCDMPAHQAAAAVLLAYSRSGKGDKKRDGEASSRGNFAAVINMLRPYAETKSFPIRGTASIVLHGARKYKW